MRERPILFSAPMVRALLAGRKTVTRRLVKWPESWLPPYAEVGDQLWVRETWGVTLDVALDQARYGATNAAHAKVRYAADGVAKERLGVERWRPSIHMPRWASRLTLEVTDVRVERLRTITEEDAVAEGVERREPGSFLVLGSEDEPPLYDTAREAFEHLWCDINGPGSWAENPWVWRVAFRVVTP